MKALRYALSLPLFAIGALFALYGVFALTFREGSGRMYVKIAGSRMDAHLAGGISLAIAALLIAAGVVANHRGRRAGG